MNPFFLSCQLPTKHLRIAQKNKHTFSDVFVFLFLGIILLFPKPFPVLLPMRQFCH